MFRYYVALNWKKLCTFVAQGKFSRDLEHNQDGWIIGTVPA